MALSTVRLDALVALARLLAPKAPAIVAGVQQAARDPAAYHRRHAARLAERNVDAPRPSLPWLALVEGLIGARALSEIDWKTDAENVAWAIGKLRGVPRGAFAWMKREPALAERSTWELLELSGQHLRERDLQLAALDLPSDSYCLVVVARADAARLVALARRARFGEATVFGDALAAATRDRIARRKRHAEEQRREAAREARRPRPRFTYFAKGATFWWMAGKATTLETAFEAPGYRYCVIHQFPSAAAQARGKRAQIAAWKASGFRELTAAQADALPRASGGYVWIAPFPARARYFLEGERITRGFLLDGTTTWTGSGAAGVSFAAIQRVVHHPTADAAARHHARQVAPYERPPYRELTRAQIAALYTKKR